MRTQERFLDASAEEFARHGYAGANLQRISAQAGMTKGALYGHFPSKDALAAVFTSAFDAGWRELFRKVGDADPPLAILHRVTVGFVHRMHTDLRFRAGLRLVYEEASARDTAPQAVADLSAELTRLVAAAQDRAELAATHSPEVLGSTFLSLMLGMCYTAPTDASPAHSTRQVCQIWQLLEAGETAA
ncbi:TetR/AcrR family transcriptional regulator [Streptomyces showdoensis]|uniref:TetR/AcrR family transcriptional regulator n=1 Tax=Streptomyces showdoensis TaxID=68268 RepID=UPI001F0B1BAC|nr:TetR/AcrR family transcriptional regulator [Streptomyces showdoensis]